MLTQSLNTSVIGNKIPRPPARLPSNSADLRGMQV
jgi:hypothetical protein